MLKNHYVFLQNRKKSGTFDENPLSFFEKKKHIFFHWAYFLCEKNSKRKKSGTFDENPCRFFLKKTHFFHWAYVLCEKFSKRAILLYFTVFFSFLRPKMSRATDFGPGNSRTRSWRSDEEPLQTSCLGKKTLESHLKKH